MIKTLRLSSNAPVLTTVSGKRLRLTAPTAIIKEAASGKPEAALVASQTERGRLIRRFEGDQNSEEELYHKEPQRVHTGMESFKFGAQPITIAIRADGDWKILARKVTYDQTEMKVSFYMLKHRGVRPYDFEGRHLSSGGIFRWGTERFPSYSLIGPARRGR